MGEAHTSVDRFMRWLIDEKWDLRNPCSMRTLYGEFAGVYGDEEPFKWSMYNRVKKRLNRGGNLVKFTIPQLVHIFFLLSVPVEHENMKALISTCGELVLDPQGQRINSYRSNDGNTWAGNHRKWRGKSTQAEGMEEETTAEGGREEAQKIQEALEEKFQLQYEIDVAMMSQRNEMADRMYEQERAARMDHIQHQVLVPRLQNVPAPSPQLSVPNPPAAPVIVQAPATAISGTEFFKALKKVAFNCDLLDVFKKIETEEANLNNKNLQVPMSMVLFSFGGYLMEIDFALKSNSQQAERTTKASLYLVALNLFVLTLGSLEPISQKIKELEKSGDKNISLDIIRRHIEDLLKLVLPKV